MGKSIGRIELTANSIGSETVKMSANILKEVKNLIKSNASLLKIQNVLKTNKIKYSINNKRLVIFTSDKNNNNTQYEYNLA